MTDPTDHNEDDAPTTRRRSAPRDAAGIDVGHVRLDYLCALIRSGALGDAIATPAAALAAIWPADPETRAPLALAGLPPDAPTPCPATPATGRPQLWLSASALPDGMLGALRAWGAADPHGMAGVVRSAIDAYAAAHGLPRGPA